MVQWLRLQVSKKKKKRLQVSIAGGMRFIPGWGTRIPCAMERSQKKKKRKKRE